MYKLILMVLITLSLNSYSQPTASDFDLATYDIPFEIKSGQSSRVHLYFAENDEDLQAQWKYWNEDVPGLSKGFEGDVAGFALVKDDRCIIVLEKFNNWNYMKGLAILGHELLHCMGGEHGAPVELPY